jgi:hypothetical protein
MIISFPDIFILFVVASLRHLTAHFNQLAIPCIGFIERALMPKPPLVWEVLGSGLIVPV